MSRLSRPGSGRALLPALLVAGVVVAGTMFLRGQPPRRARAQETPADPAATAHEAAGVEVGGASVLDAFEARLAEARARVAEDPDDREAVLVLARLLHDGHRVADAIPHYRKALELDPSEPGAYHDLASAYGAIGAWDDASEVLRRRLERDPADAVALYDLGAVLANQGRTDEAVPLFERALRHTSDGALRARISAALARAREG